MIHPYLSYKHSKFYDWKFENRIFQEYIDYIFI